MKKLVLAAALLAGGTLGLQTPTFAHGGQYRGPGDTVPSGGGGSGGGGGAAPAPSGPNSPNPSGPASPGASTPGAPGGSSPTTGGGTNSGPDLTIWSFWWEFNKEPYLNLKSAVWSGDTESGTDGWFLGKGQKTQGKDSLRPSKEQIRQTIVPALLQALEKETNNDIVTGSMIALAKIGDATNATGESEFEKVISKFLSDGNQEISETAAVSLGILANPASVATLASLLQDSADGRKLTNGEVNYRTRAFAAYGLGLIGARTSDEEVRKEIVKQLRQTIESDDTKSRDLAVSCIVAMGLVPLDTIEPPADAIPEDAKKAKKEILLPPETSRVSQLKYLLDYLTNDDNRFLVRAHCPTALARLIEGLPEGDPKTDPNCYAAWRKNVADVLLERVDERGPEKQREVVQSCVLALGLLGNNDGVDEVSKDIREALAKVAKDIADQQAKNFSMIAMAKAGGTMGAGDTDKGRDEAVKFLLGQLSKGKSTIRPWAALSVGVMIERLNRAGNGDGLGDLQAALRKSLADEKDKQRVGAYAIAAGMAGDIEANGILLEKLDKIADDTARGYVAVGLGLNNAREAIEPIQKIIADSKYRPDLLKQAAIALGLLGDKEIVDDLTGMLAEAKGLATQAAISSALGFIGDARSVDPLVEMLQNQDLTDRARGFAAVALGIVADKEELPWNTKIALDLNYRASVETLVDARNGTGILDIL